MIKLQDKPKKKSKGHYVYRGYDVNCVGYYEPEHRVCWEGVDKDGCGVAHGFSMREVCFWIDEFLKNDK